VDDTFRIDGAELHMVKLLGTVLSLTEHATNFTYQVADSTGIIECKLWIDKETGAAARFEPNTLVKICGNLREYEGRKHVLVYDIKAVEDWNEVTHHFLGEMAAFFLILV
jgi:replication factor A2